MTYCTNCGTPPKADSLFCTGCGKQMRTASPTAPPAAPPTRFRRRGRLVAALIALGLLLGTGIAVWATVTGSPTPPVAAPTPPPTQPPAETSSQATTTPPPDVDPEDAALAQLTRQISLDRPEVQGELAEKWVPQLSSKRPGIVVDGVSYTYTDILDDHLSRRSAYNARLVWSGDWSSFGEKNFYVTVAAVPFGTPAEANAWCDGQSIDSDNCFAKRLSTITGPTGSTVIR